MLARVGAVVVGGDVVGGGDVDGDGRVEGLGGPNVGLVDAAAQVRFWSWWERAGGGGPLNSESAT